MYILESTDNMSKENVVDSARRDEQIRSSSIFYVKPSFCSDLARRFYVNDAKRPFLFVSVN